jgi:hypothetical protein
MATLSYDLSVLGFGKVDQAFAQIERRASTHNQRMRGAGAGGALGSSQRGNHSLEMAHIRQEEAARLRAVKSLAAQKKHALVHAHRLELRQIEEAKQREIAALKAVNARTAANRKAMRGAVGSAALNSTASIGRGAAMVGMMGGGAIIGAGIAKQMHVSKSAAALANKAFGTAGETRSREQIQADLMKQSRQIGDVTGDRAGVIEAIDKFVAISGSLKGAQKLAGFMANIADASGANMADVGQTGGQILQSVVATKGLDLSKADDFDYAMKTVEEIMLSGAGQAKQYSIEFEQLSTSMGSVMSATTRFEGDVADLAKQMSAMSQLAIAGGADTPAEAMTAIKRFSDDLVQNAKRFDTMRKKAGVKESYFATTNLDDVKNVRLRDPTKIIESVLETTRGDQTKLTKLFGIRGRKSVEPFTAAYVSARVDRGMTHEQAMGEFRKTMATAKNATMSREEAATSATFTREQDGRSLQIEWERLTQDVGEELAPALREMVPSIRELAATLKDGVPYVKAFFEQLAQNPLGTISKVLAAKVALDIGQAAIGAAVRNALTQQVAGSGLSQAMGGAAAGFGSLTMAMAPLAIALAALVLAINDATAGLGAGQDEGSGREISGTNLINQAEASLRAGKALTPEQRKALVAYQEKVTTARERQMGALEQGSSVVGLGKAALSSATFGLTGGPGIFDLEKQKAAGPTDTEAKNVGDINAILRIDEANKQAAAAHEKAAAKLSTAADKLSKVNLPRGDQPAPPVK